jgi:glycosyltransferase involved in cell wall biosynthesis
VRKLLSLSDQPIIQAWMYHAIIFATIARIFVKYKLFFWSIHNSSVSLYRLGFTYFLFMVSIIFSWLSVDRIFFCSKAGMKKHVLCGYRGSKCVYLPNGYRPAAYSIESRSLFRRKLGISESTFVLCSLVI